MNLFTIKVHHSSASFSSSSSSTPDSTTVESPPKYSLFFLALFDKIPDEKRLLTLFPFLALRDELRADFWTRSTVVSDFLYEMIFQPFHSRKRHISPPKRYTKRVLLTNKILQQSMEELINSYSEGQRILTDQILRFLRGALS